MSQKTNTNVNLLASVALFSELCDKEKDIKIIISGFIKSTFSFESKWTLDSKEVTILLKKHFHFDFPEAVVRTCLNYLSSKENFTKVNGKYSVPADFDINEFIDILQNKKEIYDDLESHLISTYETEVNKVLSEENRKQFISCFNNFLLDNNANVEYSSYFSKYIIENEHDQNFIAKLNQVKEGVIQITGLQYAEDINQLGILNHELTIYLDTEHLFNLAGFNGELYKDIFDDFYKLINEINTFALNNFGKKIIILKYFEETKKEIDIFFDVAEKIIKRHANYSPENTAMEYICNGSSSISDVINKKSELESKIKAKGIYLQAEPDYLSKPEFNIQDIELRTKFIEKFDSKAVDNALLSFSKINFLRKGVNRTSFEKCGHIIMTGKNISLYLSHDLDIKNERKDIPFVTDITYITSRFWFRLNKGFSKGQNIPLSFDIIIKAQTVLASHLSKSIEKKYSTLRSDLKSGKISQESSESLYHHYREQVKKPEQINSGNVIETFELIFDYDIEKYQREQSYLREKAAKGEIAEKRLQEIEAEKFDKFFKKQRRKFILLKYILKTLVWLFAITVPFLILYLIQLFKTPNDTLLDIIGVFLAVLFELIYLLKYLKPLNIKIDKLTTIVFEKWINRYK